VRVDKSVSESKHKRDGEPSFLSIGMKRIVGLGGEVPGCIVQAEQVVLSGYPMKYQCNEREYVKNIFRGKVGRSGCVEPRKFCRKAEPLRYRWIKLREVRIRDLANGGVPSRGGVLDLSVVLKDSPGSRSCV